MSNKSFSVFFLLFFLFSLPSCVKYYEKSQAEFPQGIEKMDDYTELVQISLKTAKVYNQFETQATFDCLWMSDDMKRAFENVHCSKKGTNEKTKDALLRRELEESKHWITFYVLADVRDRDHVSMTDKNSLWSLYLQFGNKRVQPISIKEVELQPEIQFFFGSKFSKFKTPYLVKFPATGLGGQFYLSSVPEMKMIFSSPSKETRVEWSERENVTAIQKMKREGSIHEKDYYWV